MFSKTTRSRRILLITVISVSVLSAAILFIWDTPSVDAGMNGPSFESSVTSKMRLPNYDIRIDRDQDALTFINDARSEPARSAVELADIRDGFVRGENALRGRVKSLRVEYSADLRVPEMIGTDAWGSSAEPLSTRSGGSRTDKLRAFLGENRALIGLSTAQAASLIDGADYKNPDGKLSFASLEQRIDNIPVFRGEIKAGFAADGKLIRVINDLAPGLDDLHRSKEFGDPTESVRVAYMHIGHEIAPDETIRNPQRSTPNTYVFGVGDWATTAEKMYFPTEPGVVVPAWRVLIWEDILAYYVIVDARTGTMLWRKCITEEQSVSATYNVYGNMTSLLKSADSPSPATTGCLDPNTCPEPPIIARQNFTLVGNEGSNTFNSLGWIPDTGLPVRTPADPNITDGNNVEAGIDRDGTNGIDPAGHAVGSPTRVFDRTYNPAPGMPSPGEEPLPAGPQTYPPTPFQQGATAHGFYLVNRWHDEMYKLGFTEQARNFQHFNFGRGGIEGDRLSLEVQDSTGTNGANFSIPSDGGRPKMQNFIWTPNTPDRDGVLDATLVIHEISHGVSIRIHGNGLGLTTNIARSMGEGWSDFYTLALLSEPSDADCGVYPQGGYITQGFFAGNANQYYGIRRFPTAKIGCLGPNGLPFNPLTFANLNASNCTSLPSAFPASPIIGGACDQIHNAGEVWAAALWEVRSILMGRHGPSDGNRRSLQYVTDGMKLSPLNPNYLQSRDAIITAAFASDPADAFAVRDGFRRRGIGYSASITSTAPLVVVEAFDFAPGDYRAPVDFDGDGKTDVSIFRPAPAEWWYLRSSDGGNGALQFGASTDKLAPGDYTGDGKTDIAFWRPSTGEWYILRSEDNSFFSFPFGANGDTPVPADYDGDGKIDAAVFRGATQNWFILNSGGSGTTITTFGIAGDKPVVADYDGDGKADIAIFRPGPGEWWYSRSAGGATVALTFGTSTDKQVQGDYTGDGKSDVAFFRPSTGFWFIQRSEDNSFYSVPFGTTGDLPAPGDYDGDGKYDTTVFRPSNSTWFSNRSTAGTMIVTFGITGDQPVPAAFVP